MSVPAATRTRRLRSLSNAILIAGILAALVIYKTATPPPEDPLGDPLDSKQSLRELEMYGGQANVFAYEIRRWLGSLWQGPRLAFTVAGLAAAAGCRLAAIPLTPPDASATAAARPPEDDSGRSRQVSHSKNALSRVRWRRCAGTHCARLSRQLDPNSSSDT